MSRVTTSIVAYWLVIAGAVGTIMLVLPWPPGMLHGAAVLVLLVPGRIQGILWRDFFRGRRAMDVGQLHEALVRFTQFESGLRKTPWLRRAILLQWSFYTWNAEAMVMNNIGACHLRLGDLVAAETALERALHLDAGFPLPYFNLAVVAQARGLVEHAEQLRAEARSRGFRAGTREALISAAGSLLAQIEGSV